MNLLIYGYEIRIGDGISMCDPATFTLSILSSRERDFGQGDVVMFPAITCAAEKIDVSHRILNDFSFNGENYYILAGDTLKGNWAEIISEKHIISKKIWNYDCVECNTTNQSYCSERGTKVFCPSYDVCEKKPLELINLIGETCGNVNPSWENCY